MFRRILDTATAPDVVGLLLRDTAREIATRGSVLGTKGTLVPVTQAFVRVVWLTEPAREGRSSIYRVQRGLEFGEVVLAGDDEGYELRASQAIPWERGAPLPLYRPGNTSSAVLAGLAFARELSV